MGRTLRDAPPDTYFHVTSRGNRRQTTFVDVHDQSWFVGWLAKVAEKYEWDVLAYCLMSNHYHLAVYTPAATLSAGMQQLNGVYAQRFNWRHGHEGHLFERPFRSVIAESTEQVQEQIRYVVLNPVRAGICGQAGEWEASSYHATAGHVEPPRFLAIDRLAGLFGQGRRNWRVLFAEFITAGIGRARHVSGPGPETRPPATSEPRSRRAARPSGGTSPRARPSARGGRTGA